MWDLTDEDTPQGIVALLAILVLGTGTAIAALVPQPGKIILGVLIGLALVVAVLVLVVGAAYPTENSGLGYSTVYESDPARWLTMTTALVLSVVHGARLGHPDREHQAVQGENRASIAQLDGAWHDTVLNASDSSSCSSSTSPSAVSASVTSSTWTITWPASGRTNDEAGRPARAR